MRSRPLLICAVSAALLASAGVSSAGKKCNLVTDPSGDAVFIAPGVYPNITPLDVTSADVATGKKTLVVVLRLTSTDGKGHQAAAAGMTWEVQFTIGGVAHSFKRVLPQGGGAYTFSATANNAPIAGLTTKSDAKTITWTVPRANVPKLKTKKAVLTNFFVLDNAYEAHDYAPNDSRPSPAQYPDRAPSCVSAA